MRAAFGLLAFALMLASGCAAPGPPASEGGDGDAVDGAPDGSSGLSGDPGAAGKPVRGTGHFGGVWTVATSLTAAGYHQTDYFNKGDHEAIVLPGAVRLVARAELTGNVPGEWRFCLGPDHPESGACASGPSPLAIDVDPTAIGPGAWRVGFSVPEAGVPAGGGAAAEIRWTADVTYA